MVLRRKMANGLVLAGLICRHWTQAKPQAGSGSEQHAASEDPGRSVGFVFLLAGSSGNVRDRGVALLRCLATRSLVAAERWNDLSIGRWP